MNKKQILLVFLILWYSRFFSFLYFTIDESLFYYISYIIDGLIIYFCCTKTIGNIRKKIMNFSNITLILIFTSLFSLIPACVFYGQSPLSGTFQLMPRAILLFYFILHAYHFSRKEVLQVIICLGVCYSTIKLLQQLTYPQILFCERGRINIISGNVEQRNGFWRILMQGGECAAIMLYIKFEEFLNHKKFMSLIFVFLGAASIFLNLGRMHLTQMLLSLLLLYYLCNGVGNRIIRGFVAVFVVIAIYVNVNAIVGTDMVNLTREQVHDSDDVRRISMAYFVKESTINPIVFLLGHGPLSGTPTGNQLRQLEKDSGLYRADVGIVGLLYDYGAIYCLSIILCYVFFLYKVRKIPWIFAYHVPILMFIVFIPVLHSTTSMFFFAILMYLADIEINKKGKKIIYRVKSNKMK